MCTRCVTSLRLSTTQGSWWAIKWSSPFASTGLKSLRGSRTTSRRLPPYARRVFFLSSRRRHTRFDCDWSSDVCSSDLLREPVFERLVGLDQLNTCNQGGADEDSVRGRGRAGNPRAARGQVASERRGNLGVRSEERRVGKECRSRWSPDH